MEYLWRPGFKHLGKTTQIFMHTMFDSYCAPPYASFDNLDFGNNPGGNDAFVDDPDLETYNADFLAEKFVEYVSNISA